METTYQTNENITLDIKVQKDTLLQGYDLLYSRTETPVKTLHMVVSPPGPSKVYEFERKISVDEINELQIDLVR